MQNNSVARRIRFNRMNVTPSPSRDRSEARWFSTFLHAKFVCGSKNTFHFMNVTQSSPRDRSVPRGIPIRFHADLISSLENTLQSHGHRIIVNSWSLCSYEISSPASTRRRAPSATIRAPRGARPLILGAFVRDCRGVFLYHRCTL